MATLVGILIAALITTFLGVIGSGVEILYNYIMSDPLMNFTEILTFIPQLLFSDKTPEQAYESFYNIFAVVGISIVIIVIIISVVKSMFMPAVGKESDSPLQIVIRGFVAVAGITVYSQLIKLFVDELIIPLAQTEFFTLQLPQGTVGSGWTWNGAFEAAGILNVIFYVAILVALITASITHLERMLSFALYLLLGPVCLAFYPANESKGVASDWLKGILSQTFGIFLSLFAMNLVGKALIACSKDFTTFNLMVVIALLGFVKNSEKFINMLGFKTMPNSDTMRGIMTGLGATMIGARQISNISKPIGNGINNFRTRDIAFNTSTAQKYQQQHLNGAKLNNVEGSVNSVDNVGKKLADVQIANTKFGDGSELTPMGKTEFKKVYNQMTTDNGSFAQKFGNRKQRNEAYEQYKNRFKEAKNARENMSAEEKITGAEYEAAVGMTAFNKQMMPGSELKDVTVSDLEGKNFALDARIGQVVSENAQNPSQRSVDQELIFSNQKDVATFAGSYARVSDGGKGENETKFVGNIGQSLSSFGEAATGVSLPQTPANEFTGGPKQPGIITEGNVTVTPRVDEDRIKNSGDVKEYNVGSSVTSIEYTDGSKISMPTSKVDELNFRHNSVAENSLEANSMNINSGSNASNVTEFAAQSSTVSTPNVSHNVSLDNGASLNSVANSSKTVEISNASNSNVGAGFSNVSSSSNAANHSFETNYSSKNKNVAVDYNVSSQQAQVENKSFELSNSANKSKNLNSFENKNDRLKSKNKGDQPFKGK